MSEVLRPYLVDLGKVRNTCGSKDAALINHILASQADFIGDYEKQQRFDVENVTRNRLADLINGAVYPTGFAYLYGYCLELVCRHFGKYSPCPLFEDFHSPFLERVRDLCEPMGPSTTRKSRKPDKKKPAKLAIVLDRAGISVTCENVAFHQLQTSLASMTGQQGFANTDHDWAISGNFSGADCVTIIRDALASIQIEVLPRETVYGDALVIRKAGAGANRSSYRLKGLDFEVRRYPVSIPQYDDYPQISFLPREEFALELQALKNKTFASKEPIINDAGATHGFRGWVVITNAAELTGRLIVGYGGKLGMGEKHLPTFVPPERFQTQQRFIAARAPELAATLHPALKLATG